VSDRRSALHRSYLYASGSRPELFAKAVASGADAVILDLEDAVQSADKEAARERVASFVAASASTAGCAIQVRINRGPDGYDRDDVAAVVAPGLDALRLPKTGGAPELRELDEVLAHAEQAAGIAPGTIGLYPTIESAAGALHAAAIAGAGDRIRRIGFGATDFLADIGVWHADDERAATMHARSALVLASRAAGIGPPIDSVHTDVRDAEGLRAAALFARSLGFFGKSVIHPRQLAPVHNVFTPGPAEIARASRIVAAGADRGAALLDGELLDEAVVLRARALLAIAQRDPP
jgi:citrate lyase subunit beta / citryl-CoA lyase